MAKLMYGVFIPEENKFVAKNKLSGVDVEDATLYATPGPAKSLISTIKKSAARRSIHNNPQYQYAFPTENLSIATFELNMVKTERYGGKRK